MSSNVALFAGQGAQFVGMGKDLAADPGIAALFEKASAVLGYDLASVCFDGPIENLTRSDHCQPAIFVVSTACFAAFRKRYPSVTFSAFAGLSLGEWSALHAAGVLDFESAVRVLEARGRFMQEACEATPTGMVSVLKLDAAKVAEIAAASGAHISNINSQQQIVLSGKKDVLDKAVELTVAAKGRAIPLTVAGAFHSPYMEPARLRLAEVIRDIPFQSPKVPVLSNATGTFHRDDPAAIRDAMLAQVTGTVHWLDDVLASKADRFFEFGPGKALTNLAKRIVPETPAANVQDLATLEAASALIGG